MDGRLILTAEATKNKQNGCVVDNQSLSCSLCSPKKQSLHCNVRYPENYYKWLVWKYALSTKREGKMAGYGQVLFLRFCGPRRSRGP